MGRPDQEVEHCVASKREVLDWWTIVAKLNVEEESFRQNSGFALSRDSCLERK